MRSEEVEKWNEVEDVATEIHKLMKQVNQIAGTTLRPTS